MAVYNSTSSIRIDVCQPQFIAVFKENFTFSIKKNNKNIQKSNMSKTSNISRRSTNQEYMFLILKTNSLGSKGFAK